MTRVIVNGTFDVIHVGHIRLLEYAKSFPNAFVYVLIDSDARVKKLKGSGRPINTEYERASLLNALKCVDKVDIFETDIELEESIRIYTPNIMVKGSDYINHHIIGSQHCEKIIFYDILDKYSSTKKIQDIIARG